MTNEYLKKAEILLEALPYMRPFQGQTLVIKYGGAAMIEPELKAPSPRTSPSCSTWVSTRWWCTAAGPRSARCWPRWTSPPASWTATGSPTSRTMDVVEMVLAGKINKEIVNLINTAGGRAVGLSGKDGRRSGPKMEFYRPREDEPPEIIDIGLVGEVTAVNTDLIRTLQASTSSRSSPRWGWGKPAKLTISTPTWWPGRWPRP